MFDIVAKILRYGAIIGLSIVIIGLIVENLTNQSTVAIIGLYSIISIPIISLLVISIQLLREREYLYSALSVLTIIVIITSIILSIYE